MGSEKYGGLTELELGEIRSISLSMTDFELHVLTADYAVSIGMLSNFRVTADNRVIGVLKLNPKEEFLWNPANNNTILHALIDWATLRDVRFRKIGKHVMRFADRYGKGDVTQEETDNALSIAEVLVYISQLRICKKDE